MNIGGFGKRCKAAGRISCKQRYIIISGRGIAITGRGQSTCTAVPEIPAVGKRTPGIGHRSAGKCCRHIRAQSDIACRKRDRWRSIYSYDFSIGIGRCAVDSGKCNRVNTWRSVTARRICRRWRRPVAQVPLITRGTRGSIGEGDNQRHATGSVTSSKASNLCS